MTHTVPRRPAFTVEVPTLLSAQPKKPEWLVDCVDVRGRPIVVCVWVARLGHGIEVMVRLDETASHVVLPPPAGAQWIVNINNAFDELASVLRGNRWSGTIWPTHCHRPNGDYLDVKTTLAQASDGPTVTVQVDREGPVAVLSMSDDGDSVTPGSGPRLLTALKKAYAVRAQIVGQQP